MLYALGAALARACLKAFARWEVIGSGAMPPRGRLIVIANHQSNADPPVLVASLPRRIYFLGKEGLFSNPVAARLLRAWGVHPAARNGQDTKSLRWLIRRVEEERVVGIFPEGTRSRNGMTKPNRGLAYLALRTGSSILPVGITGTENIQSFMRILFPFCRLRVRIGEPFRLPPIDGKVSDAVLESLTDMAMQRVAALLPEEYRGAYGSGEQALDRQRSHG